MINALTEEEHPCQALADALTIRERLGTTEGVRVAWLGDGSNVCVSLARLAPLLGLELVVAAPPGATSRPSEVEIVRDPREATAGADVLVTDTWVSMGDEAGRGEATRATSSRTASTSRCSPSPSRDAIVLHCLPAHPGEEIAADVLYGPQSAVWDEAENRLHVQKAVLALLLGA